MVRLITMVFVQVALASVLGCDTKSGEASQSADAVLAVLRANMDCLNREDVVACTALMHPDSPALEPTRRMSEKLFSTYDIRYTLKDMSIESVGADEAKVKFVQITEKLAGPAFRDNRTEGVHVLRKHDGRWKLYTSNIAHVEFLDK